MPVSIDTSAPSKIGRPRSCAIVGTLDRHNFTDANGSEVTVRPELARALKLLSKTPGDSYESVAKAAGFAEGKGGSYGPGLSRAIKALAAKLDKGPTAAHIPGAN